MQTVVGCSGLQTVVVPDIEVEKREAHTLVAVRQQLLLHCELHMCAMQGVDQMQMCGVPGEGRARSGGMIEVLDVRVSVLV